MAVIKKNIIKILAVIFLGAIAALAFTLPSLFVKAETVPEFMLVQGASLRYPEDADTIINGEEMRYKGIRFTTRVNSAWFDANESSSYYFGTLVFPAKLGELDERLSVDENELMLEAIEFKVSDQKVREDGYYTTSIVYDYKTVKDLAISVGMVDANDPLIQEKVESILSKLYAMELTAVSYVVTDNGVTYTNSYTTSMTQVALKLIKDPEWTDKLSEYVKLKTPIANGYVTMENGLVGNFNADDAIEVFYENKKIDFTIQNGKIKLPNDFIEGKLGTQEQITVLDSNNNLTDVTIYYTDVAISTAEDFYKAFEVGPYSASTVYPVDRNKHYALMNDINLIGYEFRNTADATGIVFSGTFDGRGHSIANITVNMNRTNNKATQGVFGNVSGTIKNVAFINVKGYAKAGVDVGLTAPIARTFSGRLENTYIDISSSNYNNRGPFASYSYTASFKNVVINFPQYDGYVFDDATYRTVASSTSTYAYGYGALGYDTRNLSNFENVYVISPMPVNYVCGAGGESNVDTDSLTSDFFIYGENETDVWFNFTYFKNNGITNPTVENTKGAYRSSKTVVRSGLRRYDSFSDMVADKTDKNLSSIETLLSTGLWAMENGNIKWHNHSVNVTISDTVDYDADSGRIISTAFKAEDILKVTVAGEELNLENGGLVESVGGYAIRAKTSSEDAEPGVPYMNNYITENRYFAITVYTSKGTYSFESVRYNTMIINDSVELKTALDITYTETYQNNYGFYKLGNDIDMNGVAFNYSGASTYLPHALKDAGFSGQFDGDGYSLKNVNSLGRYGLFAALNHGGGTAVTKGAVIVENLAIINFNSPNNATYGTPVLAQSTKAHNYGKGIVIRNIFVQYGENAVANGLIFEPGEITMENVLVDATATNQYEYADASDGYFVSGEGVIDAWKTTSSTDGGTLFTKLRRTATNLFPVTNNVISVGYNPITYQNFSGQSGWYNKITSHTANGDGTYTHSLKNTGWGGTPIYYEVYVAYASNRRTGDVPVPVGFKPEFLELVKTVDGTTEYPAYACLGCGDTFSLNGGVCACGTELTYYLDIWSTPVSYIWSVPEIEGYENPPSSSNSAVFVFEGVSKYDTARAMADAYTKNQNLYDDFLGEKGNGLWVVNAQGELVWKNSAIKEISIKVDDKAVNNEFDIVKGGQSIVEIWNENEQIEIISITADNGVVSTLNDVVFGVKLGSANLTIRYVLNGVTFIKTLTVNVTHDYGELVSGKASTCTENGTLAHYKCSCCELYFNTSFKEIDNIVVIASHAYGDWLYLGDGTHYRVCAKDNTHVEKENCYGGVADCTNKAVCTVCNGSYGEPLGHTGGKATCENGPFCTRCSEEYGEPLGHTGGSATCEHGPFCTRCGEEYGTPNGHDFTLKVQTEKYLKTPADCYNSAVYYYGCTACDKVSTEYYLYGEPLGHTGGSATCVDGPFCTRCGEEYGTPSGHTFTLKVQSDYYLKTPADCYNSAVYYYGCTDCDEISTESYSHGAPLGHTGGKATCIDLANCSRCGVEYGDYADCDRVYEYDDNEHLLRCSVCGEVSGANKHAHTERVVTIPATCQTEGELANVCVCGHYVTEVTEKAGHVFGVFTNGKDATCTSTGTVGHYKCQVCQEYFDKYGVQLETINIPATHNFKTYNQPIAPTCTLTGSKGFYYCEDCHKYFDFYGNEMAYEDILVPATGHIDYQGRCECGEVYFDYVIDVTVDGYVMESKYFQFLYCGLKVPGVNDVNAKGEQVYTWGWVLNRYYGDVEGAPLHVRIPSQVLNPNTGKYVQIVKIGNYVFDTTGDPATYDYEDNGSRYTSPTTGNYNNKPIQSVIIPDSITQIGVSAFGATEIRELVIPNSVIGGNHTKKSNIPEGATLNDDIYTWPLSNICGGCDKLEYIKIGSGVEILGGYAFYGCSSIKKIEFVVEELPDGTKKGLKTIQQRAFGQNSGFAIDPTQPESKAGRVVLPETLISIPESSIYSEAAKQTVRLFKLFSPDPIYFLNITREELVARTIPAKLRDPSGELIYDENGNQLGVDGSIMTGRVGYTDGWCGNSTIYYKGEWYYDEDGYPRAYAEDEVPSISHEITDGTFLANSDGTIVGLTEYGKGLTELTVPEKINGVSIVKIGSNAFKGATALTTITLPSSVAVIADGGFAGVTSLKVVNATSNVVSVGANAFRNTLNVNTITIKSLISGVPDAVISGSDKIGEICNQLGAFTIAVSGTNYIVTTTDAVYTLDKNGFVYTNNNVLVAFFGTQTTVEIYDFIVEIGKGVFENKNVTKVSIPSSVTKIGEKAFKRSAITSITLPENLTEIGAEAFSGTAITTVKIPRGVASVGDMAFENCDMLYSVEWGNVQSIGFASFRNCYSLGEITLETVVSIGEQAFYNASGVRKVYLSTKVKEIGAYAFALLGSIYKLDYEGTINEWRNVKVANTWNFGSAEFDVRCSDGLGGYYDVEQEVEIVIGETYAIRYNIPNSIGALRWSSTDENVVTVKDGVIYGVQSGSADVIVTYKGKIGICHVTVGYGDFYPYLDFENSIQDGDCLEVGNDYNLRPYVIFNNQKYKDVNVRYFVNDTSVVKIENGILKALKTGTAQITVKATWRHFSYDTWKSLEHTFTVNVVGNVEFRVNGGLPLAQSVYAPTAYSKGENELTFVPTVIVDGISTYTPSVSVNYLNGATTDHFVYDRANNKLIGYKLSTGEITLTYEVFGVKFQSKILFQVLPNVVDVEGEVYFSAEDGFAFAKQGDSYVQLTMGEYLGGVDINSAESDGYDLFVDGDGALLGVAYSTLTATTSTMRVYTDIAQYNLTLKVVQRIIDSPEDFISALDLNSAVKDATTEITGYYMLIKNIDLTGYRLYNSTLTQGDAKFSAVFDGNGYAVINASIDMYRTNTGKNLSQGIFGAVTSEGVIKNVAFINLKGYVSVTANDVGLQAPFAYSFGGTIENVYVHVSPENFQNRGAIANYSKSAKIKNFVVYYECSEGFTFNEEKYFEVATGTTGRHAYGYGSLGGSVSNLASATVENVYVVSPMPVHIGTSGGGSKFLDTATNPLTITYGENETKVFVNFEYWQTLATPILQPTVQNTLGQKTNVLSNVRRYDNFDDLLADNSDRNVQKTNALLSTGLWLINANGELVWASL